MNELVEKETEVSKEAILQRVKEEEEELEDESESESEEDENESDEGEDESESESDDSENESDDEDDSNENTVPSELRRQRWFSDPMFADLSQSEESESDDEAAIAGMKQRKSQKRELPLEERLKAYSSNLSILITI